MFGELSLRALALLLMQRLSDGAVQLVSRLQLWPEVLQKILPNRRVSAERPSHTALLRSLTNATPQRFVRLNSVFLLCSCDINLPWRER